MDDLSQPLEVEDDISASVARYRTYMEAQSRLRYYAYSLRMDSQRLAERIMTEDVSDLIASINADEAEVARLKAIDF